MLRTTHIVNFVKIISLFVMFVALNTTVIATAQSTNCDYNSPTNYGQQNYNGGDCSSTGTPAAPPASDDLTNTGKRYVLIAQVGAGLLIIAAASAVLYTRSKKNIVNRQIRH